MPWEAKNTIVKVEATVIDAPQEVKDRYREEALDCIWKILVRSRKRRGLLPEDFPEER